MRIPVTIEVDSSEAEDILLAVTEEQKRKELTLRVARAICTADGHSPVFKSYIDHYTRLAEAALAVVKVVEPLDWIVL